MLAKMEIPVGGRLRFFTDNWKKITDDEWVLSVVQEGYKLEFVKKPLFSGVKETKIAFQNVEIFQKEIIELLQKDVIEKVPSQQKNFGFYSTLFLVPKKSGKLRPVTNLRPLNNYLLKKHFKMDTLSKVLNVVIPGDWAVSIDLTDAYLHVPIFPKHRQFLRFCILGHCYQWKALCFGPTSAPRVYTKVLSVVMGHLHSLNIRILAYLDDLLILNQSKEKLKQDRETCINLLVSLGFIINVEKSALTPSQTIVYLGTLFLLKEGLVKPTEERAIKLYQGVKAIIKGQSQAKDFLHLLGVIASCIEIIPNARLYMRPIQLHLLSFWKPSSLDLVKIIPVTQHLIDHLQWWLNPNNVLKGKYINQKEPSVTVTTDASKTGYGGHMNSQIVQGEWSPEQREWHINLLEMEAVFLVLKHFIRNLKGQTILIRSDNSTVVQYINKQGGTRSPQLCFKTWEIWNWAIQNQIYIKAAHVAGKANILADRLSRYKVIPTEWTLNKAIVHQIFQKWGYPLVDLFASHLNKQTQVYCSWIPDQNALAIDALTISWEDMFAWAFPPICLIPKVIQHMLKFHCQIILIAPQWPRRHWYTEILNLLMACPIRLPVIPDLLQQPKSQIRHPNPEIFNLTAWLLSTNNLKREVFLKKQRNYSVLPGEQEHRRTMCQNSRNSVAGVIQGKLIPITQL